MRTYRKGIPIPFNFNTSKKWFEQTDKEIFLNWYGNIKFNLFFGRDRSNNRTIVERCLAGEYKYADSSIQLKDRKIFFILLVIDIPITENKPNENISVGVDLGVTVPAYCALSDGLKRLSIRSKEDFASRSFAISKQKKKSSETFENGKWRKGTNKETKNF